MIKKLLLKNKSTLFLLFATLTVISSGCKKDSAPAPATAVAKPATAGQPQKPVQKPVSSATIKLVPQAVNQFDFSNKKDPFKPFVAIKPVEPKKTLQKQLRDGLPIHQFDVNQFRLIGVVTGAGESKAMVVDPKGKGYVLKIGMTIGKNDGKVTAINAAGVSVTEQFKDDNGRVRRENIKITLPRKM